MNPKLTEFVRDQPGLQIVFGRTHAAGDSIRSYKLSNAPVVVVALVSSFLDVLAYTLFLQVSRFTRDVSYISTLGHPRMIMYTMRYTAKPSWLPQPPPTIPPNMLRLATQVRSLHLSMNDLWPVNERPRNFRITQFTRFGRAEDVLQSLSTLRFLRGLTLTRFSYFSFASLCKLENLESLSIDGCCLPQEHQMPINLRSLSLRRPILQRTRRPRHIAFSKWLSQYVSSGSASRLQVLAVPACGLQSRDLKWLRNLASPSLEVLDLCDNDIAERPVTEFAGCTNLKSVHVGR